MFKMEQAIIEIRNGYDAVDAFLRASGAKKIFLVCGSSLERLPIGKYFRTLPQRSGIGIVRFSDYQPNPKYESVVKGTELFRKEGCDMIVAVGGGSGMDVAKCIKLYANMEPDTLYLKQPIIPNDIPLVAVPTTAGTGSEATRFAVIYYQGEKQSVSDTSCIPGTVILDPSALKTLPEYQRKVTMLDALCHAVESCWSVHSTEESCAYGLQAIRRILESRDGYLANTDEGNAAMLYAANLAGKAINITQTTAGHAMCYKLTGLYGIAHGHAAALCVDQLLPHMAANLDRCIDPRGPEQIRSALSRIDDAMVGTTFHRLLSELALPLPVPAEGDYALLKTSVNPDRLKNHPVALDEDTIDTLYHQIFNQGGPQWKHKN